VAHKQEKLDIFRLKSSLFTACPATKGFTAYLLHFIIKKLVYRDAVFGFSDKF